jgi:hypothetical protein
MRHTGPGPFPAPRRNGLFFRKRRHKRSRFF